MDAILAALPLVAVVVVAGGTIGLSVWWETKVRRAFVAAFERDPALVAEEPSGRFGRLQLRTRLGGDRRHQIVMDAVGGGKNNPLRWEVRAELPNLGRRTTLRVVPEGFLGHVRESLGLHDIHTGNTRIDELLNIGGENADVVRAVFANGPVQSAALALFGRDRAWSLTVDAYGSALIRIPRGKLDAEQARLTMRHVIAMVDALEHAAGLPALPEPRRDDVVDAKEERRAAEAAARLDDHGVGAASGAPVGIPLVGGKR